MPGCMYSPAAHLFMPVVSTHASSAMPEGGVPCDDSCAWASRMYQGPTVQLPASCMPAGMGIDKPDVRFVVHYTMSSSIEVPTHAHVQLEKTRSLLMLSGTSCACLALGLIEPVILQALTSGAPW